ELLPAGFRAINTYDYCVVELPSSPPSRYVTLSYTWGGTPEAKELQLEQSNQNELCKPGCLKLLSGIPDLIRDAIRFCADMGERYLWVDRLCIVQDDLEAKLEQINAMDRIYHMASFTLIAAIPLDIGLPGVVGRPRRSQVSNWNRKFHLKYRFIVDNFSPNISKSFWNSRGWTYQEFTLSRRVIFITEWQAYWIC
ncbi:heterokaryon incompatibility protein-domain-containing protein, partial [Boeremia exigua]|uniref:heterokaryon incompatibility protein-domain-containing protein n=1 Tax=Boeremia exigua TaxID=749465 RepID=UPI001E8CDB3B